MTVRSIAVIILILSGFYFGCASSTVPEGNFSPPGPAIPEYVDIKVKQQYLQNVKESLKLYKQVILDLKYYHDLYNFEELAKEINKYVNIYAKDAINDSELNRNIDTQIEVAKVYLLIISVYLDIGYNEQAWEYLDLFRDRFKSEIYLLDMTLDPEDIGYRTINMGLRKLEEKALQAGGLWVHGRMYPWQKPKRNPFQK
jgi:hypothetical protein